MIEHVAQEGIERPRGAVEIRERETAVYLTAKVDGPERGRIPGGLRALDDLRADQPLRAGGEVERLVHVVADPAVIGQILHEQAEARSRAHARIVFERVDGGLE